ncbi:MAG: outer membrane protein assembly factor BamD [Pseudomonadota bacterium]
MIPVRLPTLISGTLRTALSHALLLSLVVALAGCSWFRDDTVPLEELSANQIYGQGEAFLADGQPLAAASRFNEIERLYPFSPVAKRAIIMSAFSYYRAGAFTQARASAQRFLDLYPADNDAAYAQYLIALSYYDNIVDVGRDQKTTQDALDALNAVVSRYPNSDFARDAQLKIDLTEDHLAGKEMDVGRYYLKRGHYTAAINRFQNVLSIYGQTSHVPEAMHRLVEAYLALGLDAEARDTAAVLGTNFPGSPWYTDSFALLTGEELGEPDDDGGVISSLYRQIILGRWL